MWKKVVPHLSRLEGLYLEFIEVDQEVLQCMTKLAKLRCGLINVLFPFPLGTPVDHTERGMRHVAEHQAYVLKVQLCGVGHGLMVAPLS